MRLTALRSDILRFIVKAGYQPGDPLPTIREISDQTDTSVAKTRESLEIARALGMVDIKPGRGTRVAQYTFTPAVTLSSLYAIGQDAANFEHLRQMRIALEVTFWEEAVAELTTEDCSDLRNLIEQARAHLEGPSVQIPGTEHRDFHLKMFSRLDNPFVQGVLEAFWIAYDAFGLNLYADLKYHHNVWDYHARIVDALESGDIQRGGELLSEHMNLIRHRPSGSETGVAYDDNPGWEFE